MAQGTAVADERRARATARYVRMAPMKVRRVVDLIRGMEAREALSVLQFAPQAASEPVAKVLASAVANAEHNLRLDPAALVVSAAYVDEGPTLKRFRPRAQGRASGSTRHQPHHHRGGERRGGPAEGHGQGDQGRPAKKAPAKATSDQGRPAKKAGQGGQGAKAAPAEAPAKAAKAPRRPRPQGRAARRKATKAAAVDTRGPSRSGGDRAAGDRAPDPPWTAEAGAPAETGGAGHRRSGADHDATATGGAGTDTEEGTRSGSEGQPSTGAGSYHDRLEVPGGTGQAVQGLRQGRRGYPAHD